jgi:hypothetical protein
MRIIERVEPEVEITCAECQSRLAVGMSDLRHVLSRDITGAVDDLYRATCAVCLSDMNIPPDKIPEGWRTRMRLRSR